MQVEGKNGAAALMNKVKLGGPTVLYHGALAASAATFVGHYPWFAMVRAPIITCNCLRLCCIVLDASATSDLPLHCKRYVSCQSVLNPW